jgi:DNA-binding CsgD family transcriptional regulator/type II secretory pathway predicted ATPase ExeA
MGRIATRAEIPDPGQVRAASQSRLLERSSDLAVLNECLDAAGNGHGSLVLVSGEAGVGKTALVRSFCDGLQDSAHVFWGACDPLFTPRPLGPLLDIADVVGGDLAELVQAGARPHDVAMALRRELDGGRPALVVIEDAQWADEATLDVLRLLVGRLPGVRASVVLTYRDDNLDAWHPLRMVLGEVGTGEMVTRRQLLPLSLEAVEALAGEHGADPAELYGKTGGNPFFVTEVLAAGAGDIPPTVRDAVLARAARLSSDARKLLEAVAVVPHEVEPWLLDALAGDAKDRLSECVASGMLTSRAGTVSFRHELARLAVEAEIDDQQRTELHGRALAALSEPPAGEPDLARLAHHADAAGDAAAVLRFAPPAAMRASNVGAHREAAALYELALRFAELVPLPARAELFRGRSYECFQTIKLEPAIEAQNRAIDCFAELGDEIQRGDALSWLSYLIWQVGKLADAHEVALRAVAALELLEPGRELAAADNHMVVCMIAAEDLARAREWATRALELARSIDHPAAMTEAERALAWIDLLEGRPGAMEQLERCLALFEEAGSELGVASTHVIIVRTLGRLRMWELAGRYIHAALEYADGRDIDIWRYYTISWHAKFHLARGDWDQAAQHAEISLGEPCPFARAHALHALGLLRARRGDPDAWGPLDEGLEIALPRRELQWIAPFAAARAETAWLEGRHDVAAKEAQLASDIPVDRAESYTTALAYWQWRAGLEVDVPAVSDDPYALEMAGNWEAAAAKWDELGCPYEAAMARADSDDEDTVRGALEVLHELGARPAAAIVSRRLRERGVRGLPRGPRPSTRGNPAGLTARELEVAALLSEHLTNAAIAERLVLSEKTVDHHVSAVLKKLDVRNRGEAAAAAKELGLDSDGAPE